MKRKEEYVRKVEELLKLGYSKADLSNCLNIKRSQRVMNRYQQIINDVLEGRNYNQSHYAEKFDVSINMISQDYSILIRKANWLMKNKPSL